MTDTVKCFVPKREDEDLVTWLPLVFPCCAAFSFDCGAEPRFPLTDGLRLGEKNAELTKGTRRISTAEEKKDELTFNCKSH